MISIITPCYNSEKYIEATIKSVINQTYQNWEMLIVDDCSTDSSPEIIKYYSLYDLRIKYYKTEKSSGSPTCPRNLGLSFAKGEYIAFLDSDDLWFPTKLENQIKLFSQGNIAIVYSYYERIPENGFGWHKIVKSDGKHSYRSLLFGNEIGCLTVILRKAAICDMSFKSIGHEDYALWLSILRKGYIAVCCTKCLASYRVRNTSVSSNKIRALGWVWNIYRKEEQLPFVHSLFYLFVYVIKSIKKRIWI